MDSGQVSLCARDLDCSNGRYCDGQERCLPGTVEAGPDGCVPGEPPCTGADVSCNEDRDACEVAECDSDGDGHLRHACGGDDCDDNDPRVHGGAVEVCDADGLDEDCDPSTIYNAGPGANDGDRDGDGYVDVRCFNIRDDGTENRGTDCDDTAPTINPDGVEACDLRDNDCDGRIDEGVLETYFRDADGDGAGNESISMQACTAPAGGWVLLGGDCDDTRPNVHPGASETCDGIDNDCDTQVDEAPAGTLYYRDRDGDGYGDSATSMATCTPPPAGWVASPGDCWDDAVNDKAELVHPGATWQPRPFCRAGNLCGSPSSWECRLASTFPFTPCGGAPAGAPDWDYNCSGSTDTHPYGDGESCWFNTHPLSCSTTTVEPGFDAPRPSECGMPSQFHTGVCVWDIATRRCNPEMESRTLTCR